MNLNTFVKEESPDKPAGGAGATGRPAAAPADAPAAAPAGGVPVPAAPTPTPTPQPAPGGTGSPDEKRLKAAGELAKDIKKIDAELRKEVDGERIPETERKEIAELAKKDENFFAEMKKGDFDAAKDLLGRTSNLLNYLSPKPKELDTAEEPNTPEKVEKRLNEAKLKAEEVKNNLHGIGHSENPYVQTLYNLATFLVRVVQARLDREIKFLQPIVDDNKKNADAKAKKEAEAKAKNEAEGKMKKDPELPMPGKGAQGAAEATTAGLVAQGRQERDVAAAAPGQSPDVPLAGAGAGADGTIVQTPPGTPLGTSPGTRTPG